jgi:hypothetical protein
MLDHGVLGFVCGDVRQDPRPDAYLDLLVG